MGVILIVGRTEDPCCRLVLEQLVALKRDALLVPEDQLFPGLSFVWKPSKGRQQGSVKYNGREIDFVDIDGILSRAWSVPVGPTEFETIDGRYVSAEWNALLMAWLSAMPCVVINRIRPQLWYKAQLNPPDLAALVPIMPLRLPVTLVTTNSIDASAFCQQAQGLVRYSPLTQSSRYRIRTEDDQKKLTALNGSLPLHLVAGIAGRALDGLVVQSEVLFVKADGKITRQHGPVIGHCLKLADALGLTFCRLSLVAAPGCDWYCFGVDRSPQLYAYSPDTQIQIAQALVRTFLRYRNPP